MAGDPVAPVERLVEIAGRRVHITGHAGDSYVESLPASVREPALDYAQAALDDTSVVLDVGANIGLVLIGFGILVPNGRVLGFEPSPRCFADLERNVARTGQRHVSALNVAASDRRSELEFFDCEWFSAGSFVKGATAGAQAHSGSVMVSALPLDEVVAAERFKRVDLIKIDVEGHELAVLQGAKGTLARFRPTVIMEMNPFTITSFGGMLPMDFLATVCDTFPYVYDVHPRSGVSAVATEADRYRCVHQQFTSALSSELICRFEPLPADVVDRLAAATITASQEIAAAAPTVGDDPGNGDSAQPGAAHAAAIAEIEALRASTSWRVTAPLRWLSSRARSIARR